MNREETKRALAGIGVVPSRAMGQNFLVDDQVSKWIADQIGSEGGGTIIEVGSGLGALTTHLVGRADRLVVIEKDMRLAGRLDEEYSGREDVEIRCADATETDVRPFFAEAPVRVIGNLPYSVGAGILEIFLGEVTPVTEAVFMLQTEVAARLCASPRSKSYGALTLKVGRNWVCEFLGTVGPESFLPQPQVDSSVIRIRPRSADSLPLFDRVLFDRLVKLGFSQRRKQLRKLLPKHPDLDWEGVVDRIGVPGTVRAEEMGLEQWVEVTRLFGETFGEGQSGDEAFDVVDEANEVIRQAPRAEVHCDGLRHRAVHLLVFNKKGDVFMQKRSHLKDVYPSVWDSSAAGHLDAGEGYDEAAKRELEEELGIVAEPVSIAEIPACEETGWEFVRLYRVDHVGGKLRWPPDEIECGAFFPMSVVGDWVAKRPQDFAPGFIRCFEIFRRELGE